MDRNGRTTSHIFISYAHEDFDLANRIVDALAKNEVDSWINWKSIPVGEDWQDEIYRGIEAADAFLFLISPDSVASEPCNKEIAHAVKNGKRILPIFIANVDDRGIDGVIEKFLWDEQKKEISRRHFIKCREGQDDFNKAIEETRKTIHTDYEWLTYHTKLQVKALDWERKKDDSRLMRGKELQEAEQQFASVGSQKDPQPTDLQRNFISESRKDSLRRALQTRIFSFIFLIVVIVASVAGSILFDRTPAHISVDGQVFEVRNRFNFRFLKTDVGSTITDSVPPQIVTVDGEYLLILGTAADGIRPGSVLAYDMKGMIKWEYTVNEDPYGGPPGNFKIMKIIIDQILGNGQPQIIFTAQKSDWFPTELVLLDAEGKLLGSYWNSGFIYDVLRQDFDRDGIKELVVSAVNNNLGYLVVNDDTKHPVIIYILSPKKVITGQTFPNLIPDWPSGTEYHNWIAVFEPYVVGGIQLRTTQLDREDLIEVVFTPQGGYIWMDVFGRIRRVGLSDYWRSLEGDKSPADFICFLQSDKGEWYFPAQVNQDGICPWYVRE